MTSGSIPIPPARTRQGQSTPHETDQTSGPLVAENSSTVPKQDCNNNTVVKEVEIAPKQCDSSSGAVPKSNLVARPRPDSLKIPAPMDGYVAPNNSRNGSPSHVGSSQDGYVAPNDSSVFEPREYPEDYVSNLLNKNVSVGTHPHVFLRYQKFMKSEIPTMDTKSFLNNFFDNTLHRFSIQSRNSRLFASPSLTTLTSDIEAGSNESLPLAVRKSQLVRSDDFEDEELKTNENE